MPYNYYFIWIDQPLTGHGDQAAEMHLNLSCLLAFFLQVTFMVYLDILGVGFDRKLNFEAHEDLVTPQMPHKDLFFQDRS